MDLFYLQDSRNHAYVGDGLSFWAKDGKGYVTDLAKAELFTLDQAASHRDTDVPWPKEYIDRRTHLGVDHQYISRKDAEPKLVDGCICVLQVPKKWNGNDILFARWPIGETDRFERAYRLTLEQAQAIGDDELVIWPVDYLLMHARRVVHRQDVDLKEALRGTGIKLPKPKRPRMMMFNCLGCGRFVSDEGRFISDCRNCGADNRP